MAKKVPNDVLPDPEYGRFVPPVIDEILEDKTEDDWDEGESPEIIENDDGSVTVVDPEEVITESGFDDNLALLLDSSELGTIASDYIDLIKKDLKSREKRDEQYEEGIRRTGLGNDAPGGATFAGASKVVHPVLAEGCIDFAARAIKELCPAKGPVKTQIIGKTNGEKLQQATRKANFLNWQLTKKCPEFFTELEQTLSQLPLGGSQYIKVLPNFKQKRPEFEFVPIDKMVIPFSASNFYTAQRATHIQEITEQTFEERTVSGYYRDIEAFAPSDTPEQTKSEKATNKIEGKEGSGYNEDGLRTVYEITCYDKFDFDPLTKGELAPYVVVVDDFSDTVLAIYRNWEEMDEQRQKLDWSVEFKFIPWRGATGIGLPHLIGGMAAALTGTLRALLDSAHVNNAPTALKLKGARFNGQTQQVDITQIQEIEGAVGVDDIRKLIMPMPFNPPSQVLFQLLGWLTDAAKGVVATAEERISDASNQMPVGTALALIEQGSYTYASIHARSHNTMARLLGIVCRVNRGVLDEETIVEELGEDIIRRSDFDSPTDVVPVSDPNIFSESQRYAQIQAVMQLAVQGQQQGVEYDFHEIHRRSLELLKLSDCDDILPAKQKPTEMNAIAENLTVMLGNEILVFPEQDHISHLETHLRFATDPNFGANPLVAGRSIPPMIEHIGQHLAFMYANTCNAIASQAIPQGPGNIDVKMMDQFLAAVSAKVASASQPIFEPIGQMLQQLMQLAQQFAPKPPEDPTVAVQREIGMAEIERQKTKDQGELDLKAQALQADQQKLNLEYERMKNDFALREAEFQQERLKFQQEQYTRQVESASAVDTAQAQTEATALQQLVDFMQQAQSRSEQQFEQLTKQQEATAQALSLLAETASKPKTITVQGRDGRNITLTQG